MEILWPALGIGAIVVFVFYVLAHHWQSLLREQSWTIRRLIQRVQSLEEMADPEFRRRLIEVSPVPLEKVYTLSFRLTDRFWRDTLHLSEEDQKFIHEYGSFVGSIKVERWRSHTVATIGEVLPDRKAIGWRTRSLDFYSDPSKSSEALTLWELALSRPSLLIQRPPSLDLFLRGNSLELCGHLAPAAPHANGNGEAAAPGWDDVVFFRVPLDPVHLAGFRTRDSVDDANDDDANPPAAEMAPGANFWQACYSACNEELGFEWHLRLRDLTRKSDWERWKIFDSTATPIANRDR